MAAEKRNLIDFPAPLLKRTLLLGMGNPILCDDAIGIRLVSHFKNKLQEFIDLDIVADCSLGGFNLLDIMEGYDRLIVIDSIRTVGAIPGAWHYFTADRLRETMNLNCVHDANFATALEFGRRLNMHLPLDHDIHIFAVEILDNQTFAERMTEELEKRFLTIADEIFIHLPELLRADNQQQ
ncbi:MAG: hydrogenase maturation protease [Candidatus Aminicenantes bacterium]|nr:hydrogenase maturation protease [Candidatus Aminicenantes bacterium]